MDSVIVDRELLKQQRKQRKKEKKIAKKLEKLKEQEKTSQKQPVYTKVCVVKNLCSKNLDKSQGENVLKVNEKGEGLNKHVTSKGAIQVSLQSLQKTKDASSKKCAGKKCESIPYVGNPLDSSHPERFKGKRREEPKPKKISKLKLEVLKCEQSRSNDNRNEGELLQYCDNLITEDLNQSTIEYVKKIVQLQENAYLRDPVKAKIKKRYVLGFHELKKKLIVGKIKFFIVAPDIKIDNKDDLLYKTIKEILLIANEKQSSYAFALKRSKLGNLCKVYRRVSCFGVLNHQGAEEEFKKVLENLQKLPTENSEKNLEKTSDLYADVLEVFKEILIEDK